MPNPLSLHLPPDATGGAIDYFAMTIYQMTNCKYFTQRDAREKQDHGDRLQSGHRIHCIEMTKWSGLGHCSVL